MENKIENNKKYIADRTEVENLNFRRSEKVGDLLLQLHTLLQEPELEGMHPKFEQLNGWMKTALTLWGVPVDKIGRHIVNEVKEGRQIDESMLFLLDLLENLPSEEENRAISQYEGIVQNGKYEALVRTTEKYAIHEKDLFENEAFQRHLAIFQKHFPFAEYESPKGMLNRTTIPERNWRIVWTFDWKDKKSKFQLVLDAFCHRYNLWGFQYGKALLLKPSVNPTPHGLMIFIPAYWSFDPWRDLDWKAIRELLKARGTKRQGAKLSEMQSARKKLMKRAKAAAAKAVTKKLRGRVKIEYIREKLSLPLEMEDRDIRRLYEE